MDLSGKLHLCGDASSQIFKRDDRRRSRWWQRMFRKSDLTRKPYQILGTSNGIFEVFSDNITSVVRMEIATAVTHKLVPFRVATAHSPAIRSTDWIAEIFEEKKGVDTRALAVLTGALVKLPGAKMEVMQVDSCGRPHISICMVIMDWPRELKTRVFMELLRCTESGTKGTEVVRGRRR